LSFEAGITGYQKFLNITGGACRCDI